MYDLDPALEAVAALRREGARVHCITNTVAQNFTANVLLACGAQPSMTVSGEEAAFFTARADALLVNLGTLDADRRAGIAASLAEARGRGISVLLDPVKADLSPPRLALAKEILSNGGVCLKANRAEADILADIPVPLRAVTGRIDALSDDAGRRAAIANGDSAMDRTVATGCALGALMAALMSRSATPFDGALAALLWFGVAGEVAAAGSAGPGSFAVRFLDALSEVSIDTLRHEARIS